MAMEAIQTTEDVELSVGDVFRSILNHIVMVVMVPLVAVAVTAYLCWNVLPKTYTAETTLYVLTKTDTDTLNYNEVNLSTQLVSDYKEMAESRRVRLGAAELLGITEKELDKQYDISVDSTTSTRLLKVDVTGKNPASAANLANALAAKLSDCILEVTNVENISIIDEATPPESPSGPKSLQFTAIAGAAGLVLSIGIALLIDNTNRKIRTRSDIEQLFHIPVLAQIPIENNN